MRYKLQQEKLNLWELCMVDSIEYMKDQYTEVSDPEVTYSSRGKPTFYVEIYHSKLNERKSIRTTERMVLENRLKSICHDFSSRWEKEEARSDIDKELQLLQNDIIDKQASYENILTLLNDKKNDNIWELSKKHNCYDEKQPEPEKLQQLKSYVPNTSKLEYTFSFFEKIIPRLKSKKIQYYNDLNKIQEESRKKENEAIDNTNKEIRIKNQAIELGNKKRNEDWLSRKQKFEDKQTKYNQSVDEERQNYERGKKEYIEKYCNDYIGHYYPLTYESFDYVIEYVESTKIVIIEFQLPDLSDLPKVREYKLLASRNEIKTVNYTDKQVENNYDTVIYKIALGIPALLFNSDVLNFIDAVSFNGWVNAINKGTGNVENSCIVSIQIKKDIFKTLNYENIDPKTCFKNLKGVSASKLTSITPVQPVLAISHEDHRFVNPYSVVEELDTSTNLAAMNWEDFENLIREVFDKEFKQNGGEVKITQASRDGGVDAVAFDPDPIRGGKIVIQAKRYTNTVGVSAVRDLYGTTMNEGATKGILVTTADYGPDAYEFAKGKPLTLLNGSNLLSLLEKHGYHAFINITEAKKILGI